MKKDAFVLGFPDYGGAAVALPGTKVELESISKILKATGYAVTAREQKVATEANIKAVKAPALMHIATHGFYFPDPLKTDSIQRKFGTTAKAFSASEPRDYEPPLAASAASVAFADPI